MTGKIPDASKGLFFMFLATIVLACMHGAAWQGDGATLLRKLAGRLAG